MKNSKIKIVLTAVLFVLVVVQGNAQISKAEIVATGLTCSMCSNAINKQLKSMPEVESVSTDLNTNTFTVQLKANNTLTPKALKNSIEKTGFFIGSLVLTVDLGVVNGQENEKVQNQINKVLNDIELSVKNNRFDTTYYGELHELAVKDIEGRGFKIDKNSYYQQDGQSYSISWK